MAFTTLIDARAARDLIDRGAAAVFDCSFDLADPDAGRAAFVAGHVPGARYLHLDRDLSGPATGANGRHPLPDPAVLAEKLRAAGVGSGRQAIAYDRSGGPYAARLWWLLRWLGHEAVVVLDGGLAAWEAAGGPLETGEPGPAAPGDFTPGLPLAGTVDADAVVANLADRSFLVVDARSAERFAGTVAAMDPVPGHIPGARNRPFADNLAPDGRFKPASLLAAEFAAVLGKWAPADTVLQCGSGVTACHNALAMAVAGLDGARLYPGSWSEWIADPARPVALGAE